MCFSCCTLAGLLCIVPFLFGPRTTTPCNSNRIVKLKYPFDCTRETVAMSMNMTMDWYDTCCMIKVEFFLVESTLGPVALGWNPSLKYRGGAGARKGKERGCETKRILRTDLSGRRVVAT